MHGLPIRYNPRITNIINRIKHCWNKESLELKHTLTWFVFVQVLICQPITAFLLPETFSNELGKESKSIARIVLIILSLVIYVNGSNDCENYLIKIDMRKGSTKCALLVLLAAVLSFNVLL